MRPLLVTLLLSATAFAEIRIQPEQPRAGQLVRVTYDAGDKVGVIAKGNNPVDQHNDGQGLLLFTGLPGPGLDGTYTVIGFGESGQFIARDVTFVGATPTPNPTPVPPPPPGPGPAPDEIQDAFGFGRLAYTEAVRVGDKTGAAVLAKVWNEAANKLFSNSADIPTAVKFIETESNKRLDAGSVARWAPWARAMEQRFRDKKLDSILDHIRGFQEVSKALTVAGK